MKLLSHFVKIAKVTTLSIRPVHNPNPVLNVGLFHENMKSQPQKQVLLEKREVNKPEIPDTSYHNETGKGSIYVPNVKDYFIGVDY